MVSWILGTISMKKLLLAATILSGVAISAQAADLGVRKPSPGLPIIAAYNWTGFYVGIQGGYGFGDGIKHVSGGLSSGKFDISGGLVGGTIGYNYQLANRVVLGAEADYAWSDIKGNTAVGCAAPGCFTTLQSFGTVRARFGYAFDRILPYITGGLAVGDIKGSAGTLAVFRGSDFQTGWTIGGGVEAAIWRNVSVKAEYLYFDFGRNTYAPGPPSISTNANGHIIRAGLNYKF